MNLSLKTSILAITLHSARGELSRVGEIKCLYEKKLARPPGLRYLQSEWPSTQGHPAPRANCEFCHINGSPLFVKKCMKSSITWGGSVWRLTLLLGTTLLHINRPVGRVYLKESCPWYEGYPPYRAIFLPSVYMKRVVPADWVKVDLALLLITRLNIQILISPSFLSSFRLFRYFYLCWVKFYVNNMNLSLKT